MSQTVLPDTINYGESLPSISPSTQNFTQVFQPVNGAVFSQNQQIFIDILIISFQQFLQSSMIVVLLLVLEPL